MKRRLNFILIILFLFIIVSFNTSLFFSKALTSYPSPTPTPSLSPSPTPSPTPRLIHIILPKIDNIYLNKSYPKPLNPPVTYQYSSEIQETPYEKPIDGICIGCGIPVQLTEAEKEKIRERIKKENPPRNYINWQNNEKFSVPEPKIDSIGEDSNYYIIQLYSPLYGIASELEDSDREQILNSLSIIDATDENAFFVKISKENIQKVKDLVKSNKIRYLGEIPDGSKIDKSLGKKISDSPAEKFKITISIYEENPGQINNLKTILGTPDFTGENSISGSADSLKIKEISKLKYVKFIEENIHTYTQNLISTMAIGSDIVNAKSIKGQGIRVAVLDTGLYQFRNNEDFSGRIIDKWNFHDNNEEVGSDYCCVGHGTHVAGIIGGDGNLSDGFFTGTAPKIDFLIYKIANDVGEEKCKCRTESPNYFQLALERAAEKNADIASISLGNKEKKYAGKYDDPSKFVDTAVRGEYGKEINVVVAAGNENIFISFPGTAKNAITVGAIKNGFGKNFPYNYTYDDDSFECYEDKLNWPPGERACFSSYGPIDTDDDGEKRNKPDVVAPGVVVISARSIGGSISSYPGGSYEFKIGTSMSAPFVSGSIALFLEKYPQLKTKPEAIKAQVINTAVPSGPIDNYGYGIIDSYHMIYDDNSFETLKIFSDVIHKDAPKEFSFNVPDNTKELRLTLVWSDPAGKKEAVNRLRFDLTLPGNSVITPTFSIDENVLHYIIKGNLIPSGNHKIKVYMEDSADSAQSFGLAVGVIYKQPLLSLKAEAEKPIISKDENFTITAELSNDGYTASGPYISIDELEGFNFSAVDIYKADGSNYTYGQEYNVVSYDNLYKEDNRTYVPTGEVVVNYPRKIVWHLKPNDLLPEGEYTFTIKGNARNANEVTSKVTIYYNKDGNCACTSWQDQQCSQDICPSGQMLQTRTCSPSSCQIEKRCVARDYCNTNERKFCIDHITPGQQGVKEFGDGIICANPWRYYDLYGTGPPFVPYLIIGQGEKQFVRSWVSCIATESSGVPFTSNDYLSFIYFNNLSTEPRCVKDYINDWQSSKEFCDSKTEYSFQDISFDSPTDKIEIPSQYCYAGWGAPHIPPFITWIVSPRHILRTWWDINKDSKYDENEISNNMVLYCAQNEDCDKGYYCEKPVIENPPSYYCAKRPGIITICKSGVCNFDDINKAIQFAEPNDKIKITDSAIYNSSIQIDKDNLEFDCNGATINASGKYWGIFITENSVTLKNCKVFNAEENIRIQGDNNILSNLEISNATKYNMIIIGDSNMITNSKIINAEENIRIQGDNNILSNLEMSNPTKYNIVIFGNNNRITNSKISNAKDIGIYLGENNKNNEIKENTIENNAYGIQIDNNNTGAIYNNKIINSSMLGIFSRYNKKGMNIFLNELINRENAYSQNSNNTWYLGQIGNHWSDYDESKEGCIDQDKNHICDSPYKYGEITDNFPTTPFDYIAPNTPPTTPASIQLAPSEAFKNTEFTCTASGSSDEDNDLITYYYEFRKSSLILQAYSTNQKYTCKDNCNKGDLIYCNAKAYDGKDYSDVLKSSSIAIQNSAPVLTQIADKKVKENESLSFMIQASDIDKDKLTLTAQNLPNGASFKDNSDGTGAFSWIPSFEQSGDYQIYFKVSDSQLENSQQINVVVENVMPPCQNICFASGATQCSSNIQQTCGNYDADACLEWGAGIICPAGCTNNQCNKPDLTFSSFIVQYPRTATIPQNSPMSLSFTIKNIGNANASNVFWKYSFTDETDQKNTIPLSIPMGQSKTVFVLSSTEAAKTYNAKVSVDSDNKITELNEDNNEKTLTIQVV